MSFPKEVGFTYISYFGIYWLVTFHLSPAQVKAASEACKRCPFHENACTGIDSGGGATVSKSWDRSKRSECGVVEKLA
jgi:hypothetical protein